MKALLYVLLHNNAIQRSHYHCIHQITDILVTQKALKNHTMY